MTRRVEVLAALREAGEAGVSGESLAHRLGVSRVAVGKHVAALRAAGYEIAAAPGTGYRLVAVPDLPLPSEVAPLLSADAASFWVALNGGADTRSTNDDARALAREGAPEGTVVLAARQSAGRGRLGRSWESPAGGVYLSVVIRPNTPLGEISSLALAVALGVAFGLEELGVAPNLKWPNDVLLDGRKLAGVLLEMSADSDRVDWVVAGIGLNVRRPEERSETPRSAAPAASDARAPVTPEGAAYLADSLPGVALARVAAAELEGIHTAYVQWRDGGFPAIRSAYEARFSLTGQTVVVRDASGLARAEGPVVGVDEAGRLLVEDIRAGRAIAVVAGDVTLRA